MLCSCPAQNAKFQIPQTGVGSVPCTQNRDVMQLYWTHWRQGMRSAMRFPRVDSSRRTCAPECGQEGALDWQPPLGVDGSLYSVASPIQLESVRCLRPVSLPPAGYSWRSPPEAGLETYPSAILMHFDAHRSCVAPSSRCIAAPNLGQLCHTPHLNPVPVVDVSWCSCVLADILLSERAGSIDMLSRRQWCKSHADLFQH